MDEPPIVSNYARAEPPPKTPSHWWYLFPAVLLPLCMGSFITGQDVWLDPLARLGVVSEYPSQYVQDLAQTLSVLAAVVCGIVISTKRTTEIFKALGIYFLGFVLWGTAFLMTYGQPGVSSKSGIEPLFLSGVFGMGTLIVVVAPGTLVLWLFVWMFRTASEPARRKIAEEPVDPVKHKASMESMIEARQQINAAEQVTVVETHTVSK